MPSGGIRTSLNDMVAAITARFRERPKQQAAPTVPDMNQFKDQFQPDTGIFAPGLPLSPVDPMGVRRFDYPTGYNTQFTPRAYEPIGFKELRALAENHATTRLAIETRKDQIEGFDWQIRARDQNNASADAAGRAEKLTQFWAKPDGVTPFASWLRELVDDLLVIDAPALEVRYNRGGEIIALEPIDGGTIKPLLDETGRTPLPPAPAYEQVIHGRPWVLLQDGTRAETNDPASRLILPHQLVYAPRNRRTYKVYGFSPVEQIVLTINIGLRREHQMLQHFTEGNVPPGVLNAPDGWTPEQIRAFQEWFDSLLAGNTAARSRIMWGPAGSKYQPFTEAPYKNEFDEWLARIVCFAFSLPAFAFVQHYNRATAETAQEAALDEGLAPLLAWAKRLIDGIIQERMGHPDLEFAWDQNRELDPKTQADIQVALVDAGIIARNEARDTLGYEPDPDGDALMVATAQGPVLLSQIANPPTTAVPGEAAGAGGAPGTAPPEGGAAPSG